MCKIDSEQCIVVFWKRCDDSHLILRMSDESNNAGWGGPPDNSTLSKLDSKCQTDTKILTNMFEKLTHSVDCLKQERDELTNLLNICKTKFQKIKDVNYKMEKELREAKTENERIKEGYEKSNMKMEKQTNIYKHQNQELQNATEKCTKSIEKLQKCSKDKMKEKELISVQSKGNEKVIEKLRKETEKLIKDKCEILKSTKKDDETIRKILSEFNSSETLQIKFENDPCPDSSEENCDLDPCVEFRNPSQLDENREYSGRIQIIPIQQILKRNLAVHN